MKGRQRPRSSRHHWRRTSPPRAKRIVLRPGQRLVTSTVIVTARKAGGGGVTTSVTCECTKAEPNKPDCKPVTTQSPGGHTIYVTCEKSGGCKACKQTTTTSGVFIA
jgi:hypothetical protein